MKGNSVMDSMSPVMILKKYFGFQPQQSLSQFNEEVKALKPADKDELVKLAAVELGVSVKA